MITTAATRGAEPNPLIASLERLAATGNAEAIYHLGMAYQTGSGVPQDRAKALDAFRRSAAIGDPLGAYKLGCYSAGQGEGLVEDDETEALRYKLIAARAGYALAQQDVGMIYARRGEIATGLKWLQKSAAQGWTGGLMALSAIYNGVFGGERDPARTAAYFRLFLDRSEPSDTQRKWLTDFESKLSPIERERATAIARDYRPQPTELTIKALSGQRAATALVEGIR